MGFNDHVLSRWAEVAKRVRNLCLSYYPQFVWPSLYIYVNGREAMEDQILDIHHHEQLTTLRGWSMFNEGHIFGRNEFGRPDRTVLILQNLGGIHPIASTLIHESVHHLFWQRDRIPYSQQITRDGEYAVRKEASTIYRQYMDLPEIPEDSGAYIRCIDHLQQRSSDGKFLATPNT